MRFAADRRSTKPATSRMSAERVFEQLAERFWFERNGTNHEVGLEFEDLRNGFELPAVAELREMFDRSDIRTPARDTDERSARAEVAKDRGCIWGERDDTHTRNG